jgi:hypothetical protein
MTRFVVERGAVLHLARRVGGIVPRATIEALKTA